MRLNDFQSHMVSLERRWAGFFANLNYTRAGNTITWPNRIRFDVDTTPDLFVTLVEHRQYSMQVLDDGSIFQIYYGFDPSGARLHEASLGFYHAGYLLEAVSETVTEGVIPIGGDYNAGGWIRFDYDPSAARDCLHYHSHLHTSLSPEIRIPVNGVPTPKQFVELVVSWFYPEIYREIRLSKDSFQLSDGDANVLFNDEIELWADIPALNGIHIYLP